MAGQVEQRDEDEEEHAETQGKDRRYGMETTGGKEAMNLPNVAHNKVADGVSEKDSAEVVSTMVSKTHRRHPPT